MKLNSSSIADVCRTCLSKNETLAKIADSNITIGETTKPALDLLNMLTPLELKGDWPISICLDCLGKVTDIYKFKLQCETSNSYLENYFTNKNANAGFDVEDVASKDCKYEIDDFTGEATLAEFKYEVDNNLAIERLPCKEDNFHCSSKSFPSSKTDLQHKRSHCLKEPVFCTICNKKYISPNVLRKHIKEAHNDENAAENELITHVCTTCNKAFKTKYILMVHERRHKLKGQFLCPTCGKGFDSKGCLTRHTRVHTGEKKFECLICKKRFPSNNNLKLHSRIHSGIKPYLCTVCGKSFSHPTGLTYHLKTHTKEKNYHCDICDKAFALQCHLDNHRKIHTGERPFQCKTCDRGFIKKVDLQRHEAVHSGTKPHVCSICSKEFLRELHLHYHMMIHTEERPHKCSYCGKGFIRRYYLKDHIAKHHEVPPLDNEQI